MKSLTVLYDEGCGLCRRARQWLEVQAQFVPLRFVAAGGEEARRLFPTLDHPATLDQLTVIADTGELYRGEKAWVMCLWALREHRSKALTMRSPTAQWAARRFVHAVSKNRHRLSALGGDA